MCVSCSGLDPSQRQGVEELISATPCRFDHATLFTILQKHTLQHRMNDSFSCLVRSHEHNKDGHRFSTTRQSSAVSQTGREGLTLLMTFEFLKVVL